MKILCPQYMYSLLSILLIFPLACSVQPKEDLDIPTVPVEGMVTLLDLGSTKCIPCKMMAPILDEVEREYKGRAAVVFIDVWQNKKQAEKYKIKAIPTQIFFNRNGEEVERHTGFLDKQSIIEKLEKLGVK